MGFEKYYAAILKNRTRTEPRADEAMRDYLAMQNSMLVAAAMF